MALEINAQYAKFVMFAQQQPDAATSKAIARATGDEDPLAGRTISVSDTDHVRGAFNWRTRSDDDAARNNETRSLFRQAVADMFGGDNHIPESVKKAMKLGDYGSAERPSGKPLTARRIMAVKAAVDEIFGRVPPALNQAKANADVLYAPVNGVPVPEDRRNAADGLLDTLVRATAVDKDALEVAVANPVRFVRGSNAALRTDAEVQAKGRSLLAAVAELRTLAKGDRALFEIGKEFLKEMNGADIPEGFIRSLVETSKLVKIAAIRGLSASSSGKAIHKAVCEFSDNLKKITDAVELESRFDGADERKAVRNFAAALILHRCGDKEARNIASAMGSAKVGTLNALYAQVGIEDFDKHGHSPDLVQHTAAQAVRLSDMMDSLNLAAQTRLNIPVSEMSRIPDVDAPDYRTIDGGRILDSLLERGRAAAAAQKAEFAKNAVAGEGELADKLRAPYMRFGGPEAYEPDKKLAAKRNGIILSMLNGTVCEEGKKLAGQNVNGSQFVLDLDRCPFVKLPGGQTLENHSFDIARDQLASLVTNGAKTTYESLDDLGKGKVRFLMSILNQKAATNVLPSGEMIALNPDGRAFQIQVGGANSWELNVALDQDGTLSISGKLVNSNLTHFIVLGDDDKEEYYTDNVNPATKIEYNFNLKIKADEFSRLASLDYTKCDTAAVDRMIADPNVKDPHSKYGQALGGKFAFRTDNSRITCTSSCKITVA